ncbi:heterokaryon incompatibility protein [Colletotrichum tofieldiae]|nr:heterokaryon incompatibility protein [Colletotrichum tofieldiae]
MDDLGEWGIDEGYLEEDEIVDVNYSGTEILVEHAGDDRFRWIGAVGVRQADRASLRHLQQACGQGDERLDEELDVEDE